MRQGSRLKLNVRPTLRSRRAGGGVRPSPRSNRLDSVQPAATGREQRSISIQSPHSHPRFGAVEAVPPLPSRSARFLNPAGCARSEPVGNALASHGPGEPLCGTWPDSIRLCLSKRRAPALQLPDSDEGRPTYGESRHAPDTNEGQTEVGSWCPVVRHSPASWRAGGVPHLTEAASSTVTRTSEPLQRISGTYIAWPSTGSAWNLPGTSARKS
jgi:hypothetical protein